jgi:hypothetical protein
MTLFVGFWEFPRVEPAEYFDFIEGKEKAISFIKDAKFTITPKQIDDAVKKIEAAETDLFLTTTYGLFEFAETEICPIMDKTALTLSRKAAYDYFTKNQILTDEEFRNRMFGSLEALLEITYGGNGKNFNIKFTELRDKDGIAHLGHYLTDKVSTYDFLCEMGITRDIIDSAISKNCPEGEFLWIEVYMDTDGSKSINLFQKNERVTSRVITIPTWIIRLNEDKNNDEIKLCLLRSICNSVLFFGTNDKETEAPSTFAKSPNGDGSTISFLCFTLGHIINNYVKDVITCRKLGKAIVKYVIDNNNSGLLIQDLNGWAHLETDFLAKNIGLV